MAVCTGLDRFRVGFRRVEVSLPTAMETPVSDRARFEAYLTALVECLAIRSALECAETSRPYIDAQVYAYTSQAEAGVYYREAAGYQAAWNAVYVGIAGLCTMYLGGLIMGAFARSAGIGVTTTESVAAGEAALAQGGARALLHRIGWPTLGSFVETTVLEGTLGIPVRAGLGMAASVTTDAAIGRHRWTSVTAGPAGAALGGVLRAGPAVGMITGHAGGTVEEALERRWRAELAQPGVEKVLEHAMATAARTLDARIKACGRLAPLLLASRDTLDREVRVPITTQVDRVTAKIALANRGIIWDADKSEIRAGVEARFGAEIWAPISRDTDRAHTTLRLDQRRAWARLRRAQMAWANQPR